MNTEQHTQHDGDAFAFIACREYFTTSGHTMTSARVFYAGHVWTIPATHAHGYAWAVKTARDAIGNPAAIVAVDTVRVSRKGDLHTDPNRYGLPNPTTTGSTAAY